MPDLEHQRVMMFSFFYLRISELRLEIKGRKCPINQELQKRPGMVKTVLVTPATHPILVGVTSLLVHLAPEN